MYIFLVDDTATILNLNQALKFNGGGHINHTLFWETLTPCSTKPSGKFVFVRINSFFFYIKKEIFKLYIYMYSYHRTSHGQNKQTVGTQNKNYSILH